MSKYTDLGTELCLQALHSKDVSQQQNQGLCWTTSALEKYREMFEESRTAQPAVGPEIDRLRRREDELPREARRQNNERAKLDAQPPRNRTYLESHKSRTSETTAIDLRNTSDNFSDWAALGPWNLPPAPPATLAFWTRARRMPPAAPWARPRVVTTPSPLSYTQPHNNVTTPLRWRYLASSLARTCDLLMSSLQPWVTPTPHWTCPSALHTLWRLAPTAPSPGWRPNSNTMGPHLAALLRQNISYTPIVWSAYGRPHPDTLTVLRSLSKSIARKRNIASAEVVFHRLHSSITLEIWRRSARQIRTCWPVTDLPAILDMDI